MRTPEAWSWGGGAVDRSPPIASPQAQSRARELALRHSLEALSDDTLGPVLQAHFSTGDADAHARFVRLLTTVRALVDAVLPTLRRRLRCETRDTRREMREPSGGRLDPIASLRTAATRGSASPELWVVSRRERLVDTPINRLIVAILRDVEAKLLASLRSDDARWRAMTGERSLLHDAQRKLQHFFATTPLDTLATPKEPVERLRREAVLRRSEYERIASFVGWWESFQTAHLDALRADTEGDALPTEGCYELCAALGLALALRRRYVPTAPERDGTFRFRGADIELTLRFGRRPSGSRHGRGATAWLTVHRGTTPPSDIVVEARNQRDETASELAQRLDLWLAQTPGARALLLTPTAPSPNDGDALVWRAFLTDLREGSERCDPAKDWDALLDELFREAPTEGRRQ